MPWVIFYLMLVVGGFAVLGMAGLQLWGDVRELGQTVSTASRRLADAAGPVEEAPRSGQAGEGREPPR